MPDMIRGAILAAVLAAALVGEARAHIPEECNPQLNAASEATRKYNRATNVANDHVERLLSVRNPTAPALLRDYFQAAQTQSAGVGNMTRATEVPVFCIGNR